ncbi:MAG: GntR family transcriptional regulator [Burkholderia contaminans]|uniref:GntR family transcriptional regulator n=1 Tax=Burkholderia contaminans TaxID=488447 RepID=A0AAP4VGE1_9BURK|nr:MULTISPECIES: GntR family transcriptional regulator [Burkholderia]MBD1410015.1 GntR family transcriptional regulator [Burkholderia contaminans]MBH9668355.1 GntR family transcriptional regulator [Burkholderia contaminans]MBH9675363.1 GntR family transcriptional regulator [Burkholderia contaminans]MBH9705787.1 GntR family transcriptional regulator [Burkholderia contaminans]MBM6425490.1 GntR family transcriptional regulator [Burkholderia contaminans]
MTLVRDDATSLYEQIATTLRDEIEQGVYEPTGKLPSEAQLSERFQVSRVTVRLALDRLADARIVERKQGKGTFAAKQRLRHRLDVLRGLHDSIAGQGARARMELLRMETCDVPPGLRQVFAADVTRCIYLERLHWVDDEPIALAQTCLLPEASDVAYAQADSMPTYELLEQLLGWRIADADMSVTAVAAPDDIAALLTTGKLAPLLVLRRTSRLADGRTCESTLFHIRPERFDLVVRSGVEARFVAHGTPSVGDRDDGAAR